MKKLKEGNKFRKDFLNLLYSVNIIKKRSIYYEEYDSIK